MYICKQIKNNMLAIVDYIKKYGLNKAVSEFKLIVKEYEHKILLKYVIY